MPCGRINGRFRMYVRTAWRATAVCVYALRNARAVLLLFHYSPASSPIGLPPLYDPRPSRLTRVTRYTHKNTYYAVRPPVGTYAAQVVATTLFALRPTFCVYYFTAVSPFNAISFFFFSSQLWPLLLSRFSRVRTNRFDRNALSLRRRAHENPIAFFDHNVTRIVSPK